MIVVAAVLLEAAPGGPVSGFQIHPAAPGAHDGAGSRFSPVLRLPSLSAILEYATSSEQSAEKKDSFLCKKAGIQNRVPSYLRTYNKKKPLAFTDFYTV